jgi:GGDEF domain-containing protein
MCAPTVWRLRGPFPQIKAGTKKNSIGISLYPQDARDIEELIHIADMAMYREKQSRSR